MTTLERLRNAIGSALPAPDATAGGAVGAEREGDVARFLRAMANGEYGAQTPGGPHSEACAALAASLAREAADNAAEIVETAIVANEVGIVAARLVAPAKSVSESAAAMAAATQEMVATVASIDHSARAASLAAEAAEASMRSSVEQTRATIEAIERLARLVQRNAAEVRDLGKASEEIGGIVGAIERIAAQTRLLALNATIEAARAGEAGRGFAVVAKEVKTLAQQTAQATEDIRRRIAGLLSRVAAVVESMSRCDEEARDGRSRMERLGEEVQAAGERIDSATRSIREIAVAVSQQSQATNEIAESIGRVAAMARETAQAVEDMAESFDRLDTTIGRQLKRAAAAEFPEKVIILAKADHVMWKRRLVAMAAGRLKLKADELADHRSCRLGKWYYGEGSRPFRCERAFAELEEPHRKVHEHGKEAARLFAEGKTDQALAEIAKVEAASDEVLRLLEELRHRTRATGSFG
ncbi:MAG: methyl-accepting chemotaxis protein [Acetobacteraceae bacterium]|nr:methyl-accepting chemotaxis protein [Acetobacteraceae bacterium]